jgi:hypothetical protein
MIAFGSRPRVCANHRGATLRTAPRLESRKIISAPILALAGQRLVVGGINSLNFRIPVRLSVCALSVNWFHLPACQTIFQAWITSAIPGVASRCVYVVELSSIDVDELYSGFWKAVLEAVVKSV